MFKTPKMMNLFLVTIFFIQFVQPLTLFAFAHDEINSDLVARFAQVDKDFYRSARPTQQDLLNIKEKYHMGLILNIENNNQAIKNEEQIAKEIDVEFISSPMSWATPPNDDQVNEILALLRSDARGTVLLHCKHGEDRTGLIVGLYRVLVQKWAPKAAYEEMLKMGFHQEFKALDKYFRDRTGL